MAKTLKQILDGVKSSRLKTKDILGTKPGVDYSPKAGDERKFADKHHVDQHADRVGNGSDVYSATNVKSYMDTDKAAHHGHKAGEDEKVYEAFDSNIDYGHDKHALDHAAAARTHHVLAALGRSKHMKDDKAAQYHQDAAGAHHMADLAHHLAKNSHSSGSPTRHDDSVKAHKASKDAHKLSDIAYLHPWNTNEEVMALRTEEKTKCNMTEAGKMCEVHGMKQCPGKVLKEKPVKEENISETLVQNYVNGFKDKRAEVHKIGDDWMVKKYSAAYGGKEVGTSKHGDSTSAHAAAKKHLGEDLDPYNPKDIGFDFKYGGQNKGRRAEVHRMPSGHYEVRKYKNPKFDLGTGDHVETVKHTDRVKAGIEAQNFANMKEDVELVEKQPIAKGKQTMLVTMKKDPHAKSGGATKRIKKSEYDPKIHDLAEDQEINELSKKTLNRYVKKAHDDLRATGISRRHSQMMSTKPGDKWDSEAKWLDQHAAKRGAGIHKALNKMEETEIEERKMSSAEMDKREHIVKGMKKKLSDFRARYGKRAKDVMYATATKQAMKEDLAQPLIGSTDPTKNKKGKKKEMEQSAPAVTPITLPNFSVDVNTGRNV